MIKQSRLRGSLIVMVWAGLQFTSLATSWAGDWPGWRGSTGSGLADEKDLPLNWNAKTGEGVLWKVSLAGTTGHSSPIVWGDRLFLTTATRQTREQEANKEVPEHQLACYKTRDGSLLWKTTIAPGQESAGYSIYAVPTPVTDGKAVYAWFGSAVIAAVDFEGRPLWRHERSGPFLLNPGICSSPRLYQDTVILLVDQGRGQGYLQGLDKKTGQVKWEQKRTKAQQNNTTPLLIQVQGKTQMVIAGSQLLEGLEPSTGEPVWWCKTPGFGESPIAADGLVYSNKGGNEPAVLVDPRGEGDVAETHVRLLKIRP
jgi:outer membrane protein assembly factor BamB